MKMKKKPAVEAVRLDFPDGGAPVNPYYLSIAEKYRAASLLAWCALVAYLIVMLCLFRDSITYDNLTYLIKDFDADVIGYTESAETVKYDEDDSAVFCRYKGRLVRAGTKSFCMYSASGDVELENDRIMENPTLVSSDKYVFEYDLGGTEYNMYSSLAKVNSGSSGTEISAAALGDDGEFALVSRSKESKYLVTLFSSSFKETAKVYKDKFVMSVMFGDGGEYVIVSAGAENSSVYTEIMFCREGSDESSSVTVPGMMPLKAGRLGAGYAVICDGAVVICSGGAVQSQYDFGGKEILFGDVSDGTAAVLCGDNALGSTATLSVYGETGELLYTKETEGRATGFWCGGDGCAVMKSDGALRCISPEKDESTDNSDNVIDCVFYDDRIMICTPTLSYRAFDGGESDE